MYNASLNAIKKELDSVKEKIRNLESDNKLKEILEKLADLILSTANTSLFAVDDLNKKIGDIRF